MAERFKPVFRKEGSSQEGKFFFYDAGGWFEPFKEQAYQSCHWTHHLTIYSLTPKGESQPARLIIKMTPRDHEDGYLSLKRLDKPEAFVRMISVDYSKYNPDRLAGICKGGSADESNGPFRHVSFTHYPRSAGPHNASIEEFFDLEPNDPEEPGAAIYLRDKAFFQSMLPDAKHPDFFGLPLLTDDQRKEVLDVDLSRADVRGVRYLSRVFAHLERVTELDLSAFDTAGAKSMKNLFMHCKAMRRVDLSAFDFSGVEDVKMFYGCDHFEEIILSDTISCVKVSHKTGRMTTHWEEVWSEGHSRSQGYYSGTLREVQVSVPEIVKVNFDQASYEEMLEALGLRRFNAFGEPECNAKIILVPHQGPR